MPKADKSNRQIAIRLAVMAIVTLVSIVLTKHFGIDHDLVSIAGESILTAICDRGVSMFFGGAA